MPLVDHAAKATLPSCSKCTLLDQPGPCFGSGSKAFAQILYVAQNPGSHEVECEPKTPLVGPSGNTFNRQLTEAGLRRENLYVTNVVKCLTPNNRVPTQHEINCCRPILAQELDQCKADVVVLAGEVAMRTLLGDYSSIHPKYIPKTSKGQPVGIMSRAGCVETRHGRKWIVTIHPAHVMRVQEWRFAAIDHLKKAGSLVGVTLPELKINTEASLPEIEQATHTTLTDTHHFSCDVETHGTTFLEEDDYCGGDQSMDICGISPEPYRALVFDAPLVHHLSPIFQSPTTLCSMHNGSFDLYHIYKHIPQPTHQCQHFDTMLGTHYLRSYAPKKLKPFVVSQYTNLPYFNRDLQTVGRRLYNAMDCIATRLAADEEIRQLKEWKLYDLYYEFGQPILPILEEQRIIGVRCDIRKTLFFQKYFEMRIEKAEELLAKIAGPFFNWGSPKQVASLLYDTWSLPTQYNLKAVKGVRTQVVTVDNEARKRLRRWVTSFGDPNGKHKLALMVLELLDFLTGEKQKLEFLGRVAPDGRIHPYYKAHGEESFRLSSTPNVQNLPVSDVSDWGGARADGKADSDPTGMGEAGQGRGSIRSIIVADRDEDWILTCDYSQMQLWIYAAQFNVEWMLKVKESGEYIYGVVYESLYKEPFFDSTGRTKEHKLKTVSPQRIRRAKAVPLGFMFGRSAKAVAEEYGWPLSEGKALQDWWFRLNPEIPNSFEQIKYKLFQQGWIRHCFGQVLHYPTPKLTEAVNAHAQSPEAFVMLETQILIDKELKRRGLQHHGVRIMMTVHDSISLNVPEHLVQEVYEDIVAPVLLRPIPQLKGLRFDHEATLSKALDWEAIDYARWQRARAANRNSSPPAQGEET